MQTVYTVCIDTSTENINLMGNTWKTTPIKVSSGIYTPRRQYAGNRKKYLQSIKPGKWPHSMFSGFDILIFVTFDRTLFQTRELVGFHTLPFSDY